MSNLYIIIPIFLLLAVGTLFLGHYFFYYSLVYFLKINSAPVKLILKIVLSILGLSFILASVWVRYQDTWMSRGAYFYSGVWLGVLGNFILALIAIWLIFFLAKILPGQLNFKIITLVFLFLSLGYSVYGVYNAYHPQLKFITVKIKNLPVTWQGKTTVQLSDVHLGHIFRDQFLQGVVDQVNSVGPDLVVIAGDLFDGMDGDLELFTSPLKHLQASAGSYFITGNHETYLGTEQAYSIIRKTPVKILNDQLVDLDGLQLIGIAYPERMAKKDLAATIKSLPGFDSNKPSVLLYHDPVQIEATKNIGVNLQLAGHTHHGQVWPINYITELIYGSYYYGLHTIGDYNLYTSAGTGVWGPTMRTGKAPEVVVIKLEIGN